MQYQSLGNPIWSGQLQLLGGARRVIIVSIVYAACLTVGFQLLRRFGSFGTTAAAAGQAMTYLAWVQLGLLIAGGTGALHKGLVREHRSRMLESLRTTPLRALTMVIGFVFGPVLQILLLWAVGVIFGLLLATAGGGGGGYEWILGNGFMVLLAACAWSAQVFFGVGYNQPVNIPIMVYIACFVLHSAEQALRFLPGAGLFTGVFAAFLSVPVALGGARIELGYAIGVLVPFLMIVFWTYAAAGRFRRPYRPALGVWMALLLVALWAGSTVLGLRQHEDLYPNSKMNADTFSLACVISINTILVFQCFPISSAVKIRRRLIMGANAMEFGDRWPPILYACLSAAIAIASYFALLAINQDDITYIHCGGAVALLLAALVACGAFKLTCYIAANTSVAWLLVLCIWFVPLIAAAAWEAAVTSQVAGFLPRHGYEVLFVCSPLPVISQSWRGDGTHLFAGLAIQAAIAIAMLLSGEAARRWLMRDREAMLVKDPAASRT